MALPKPFGEYIRTQKKYDAIIMRILEAAAIAIQKRLQRLDTTRFSNTVRAAQLRLALAEIRRDQQDMWLSIGDVIQAGQIEAALVAADDLDRINRVLFASLPADVAEILAESIQKTARSGIKSLYARKAVAISPKVMLDNSRTTVDAIEEIIQSSLASGLSAKEFAREVRSYISPRTPGGASYAAMRISRTEINNAFHQRQIASMDSPGVEGAKWNLSGSHKKPDDCNKFAEQDQYDMGAGVFPPGKMPNKPHPHCLCYLTMVTMDPEQFVAGLKAGKFDDELRKRFNINRQELGLGPDTGAKPARPLKSVPKSAAPPKSITPKVTAKTEAHLKDINKVFGKHREPIHRALVNQAGFAPRTMGRLRQVDVLEGNELESFYYRNGRDAVGAYRVDDRRLMITPQNMTAAAEKSFQKELKSGWSSKCGHGNLGSFIAHECGHHVHAMTRNLPDALTKELWQGVAQSLGAPRPLLFDQGSLDQWVIRNADLLGKKVSRYGATDSSELLAEIWAEYTTNAEARGHIAEIGRLLQRLAEQGAK